MIGRKIGRYRVLSRLGAGGMATVWEARDELLGHTVALKVLADALAQSPEARRRFRHEAEIVQWFDHPAVAAIYEAGESEGRAYIAMSRIEGETLAERIARGPLAVTETLRITGIVAAALGYAHARGVIHRDVTPRNIMLASDGRVLVLDFGLAIAEQISRVTSAPRAIGTAAYVSPEVLLGADADPRSDLFALGVVCYEMLTGALPFRAERQEVLTYAVLTQDVPPPGTLRPGIPGCVDGIVLRLLSRDRRERHANADELLADLKACEREAQLRGPASSTAGEASPRNGTGAAAMLERQDAARCLAVAPLVASPGPGADAIAAGALALDLTAALGSRLARARRLHVVTLEQAEEGRGPATWVQAAVRAGAHLLLTGTVRVEAGCARVEVAIRDPGAGVAIAAERAEGPAMDAFALEDALVTSVTRALRLPPPDSAVRPLVSDRAAGEHYEQAVRYLRRHDHEPSVDAAIRLLDRLVEAGRGLPASRALLVRACLAKFQLVGEHAWESRAHAEVSRALEEAPDHPDVRTALAYVRLLAGRREEALAEFGRVLEATPNDVEALLGASRALQSMGRETEAEAACRRVIALSPEDWRGFHQLGLLLFRRGEWARAVEPWRRVLQLTPDNARAAGNLGGALIHLDRLEEAADVLRRSLAIAPNGLAYQNLGTSEFHLSRFAAAADAFERAVALLPSDPVAWGNLGNACRFMADRSERAHEALERAVALGRERLARRPTDAETWGRLAGWLVNLGRHEEALEALARALGLAPGDVQVMARAVHVHAQAGRPDDALAWMARAVRRGYAPQAFRRSPDLAALRADPRFEAALAAVSPPGNPSPA